MSETRVMDIQAVERQPQDRYEPGAAQELSASGWRKLYRIGAGAAFAVVALIPLQAAIFVVWQPPTTVFGFFDAFQQNALLGLLDLDVLMIFDQLLIIVVLLALYVALSPHEPSLMLLATVFGMIGAGLFMVSREATISMFWLSQQYASANSQADQAPLVAAGQMLLTTYNGTAYCVAYILSGLAMLRHSVFSRATGVVGVLAGAIGLVPATFGTVGLALGFISLIPLLVWLVLVGRRLLKLEPASQQRRRCESCL
jgi:hypothetical protein